MRKMLLAIAMVPWVAFTAEQADALKGAAAVLQEIKAGVEAAKKKTDDNKDTPTGAFEAAVKRFAQEADGLAPDAAAERWLELADQHIGLGADADKGRDIFRGEFYDDSDDTADLTFGKLVMALPAPNTWGLIREGLDKRQQAAYAPRRAFLQILMAYLARDIETAQRLLTALKDKDVLSSSEYSELTTDLAGEEKDYRQEELEKLQAALKSPTVSQRGSTHYLPDLAEMLPMEEAEQLLRAVFKQRLPVEFKYDAGEETIALAQRVALEMRDELVAPYWNLVTDSPEGGALYALFAERFKPFEQELRFEKDGSLPYEIMQRVREVTGALEKAVAMKLKDGRVDEALKLAHPFVSMVAKIPQENGDRSSTLSFSIGDRSIRIPAQHKFDFYVRLLGQAPSLPIPRAFALSGIACGREDEVEQFFLKRLDDAALPPSQRRMLREVYADFLLAVDRVAEAVALRNGILADALKSKTKTEYDDWVNSGYALETAKLAALANDDKAQRVSLDHALKIWGMLQEGGWHLESLIEGLEQSGRESEVEPLLIDHMVKQLVDEDEDERNDARFSKRLLSFYVRRHRMADAMALLETSPWWGKARDALDVLEDGGSDFANALANTLYEAGRVVEAKQLLAEIMRGNHSMDWSYELLLKTAGDDLNGFIAQMDALYARSAFEERPLIWKAEALRRLNRLEEAERVIRHALKVDPTDGEQPPGDRCRAYAVLAEILDAQGKADDAKFFRDVVESVRVAEKGDEFKDLGLARRSFECYAKAEALFADAYCVQWRLAEQLCEMGKPEEARKHYEIAFERMPEQFGQVASLCFHCMGVFDSPESVSAGEGVLTRLAGMPPVRPTVYYLLGQLRETQKRYAEAADWYAKALEADPDYLDVMTNLYGLKGKLKESDIDWTALQNKMLRLAPLTLRFDECEILDWSTFWGIRNAAIKTLPPPLEALFPLTANVKRLDDAGETPRQQASRHYRNYYRSYNRRFRSSNLTGADVLLAVPFAKGLAQADARLARATGEEEE
ncbi:MAG: tetratricopeptide repeat protein [Kiritimatiellaeota bacterium]|nr:tetratricopeptide repeat protein [Kiritimatiellota bacterium]